MPVSLLTLPYELREQILTSLLCKGGSIKLQQTTECKAALKLPISQVCRILREEAVRLFYRVNTFTLIIDPEAVSTVFFLLYPDATHADVDRISWNSSILSLAYSHPLRRAMMENPLLIFRSSRNHGISQISRRTSAT